jgi:hypothetical protein
VQRRKVCAGMPAAVIAHAVAARNGHPRFPRLAWPGASTIRFMHALPFLRRDPIGLPR